LVFFIFNIYISNSKFEINNFLIKKNRDSFDIDILFYENTVKFGIIEYYYIPEDVDNKNKFPVPYFCYVPLNVMSAVERYTHLLEDCSNKTGISTKDLILIYLVDGLVMDDSSHEANEKICIYQLNKNVRQEKKEKYKEEDKEEEEIEDNEELGDENKKKKPVNKDKKKEIEMKENEEQIFVLNFKNSRNSKTPPCIPFVFRCESSQVETEVLVYILF
jgi:hypothetical protein